jgi:hypothetical protein
MQRMKKLKLDKESLCRLTEAFVGPCAAIAFTIVFAVFPAKAWADCVMCCPDCYCPPCDPGTGDPPVPVGYITTSVGDNAIYQYHGEQVTHSWPVVQNLWSQTVVQRVSDYTGIPYDQLANECYWRGTYPPSLDCGPVDPNFFTAPFIWLSNEVNRQQDLIMLQLDGMVHWIGVPSGTPDSILQFLDPCAYDHVSCEWHPWDGPRCEGYPSDGCGGT